MSELDTPYTLGGQYFNDRGVSITTVIDCNDFGVFSAYTLDADEVIKRINGYTDLEQQLAEAKDLSEKLKQEAKIHAMEAGTQKGTVYDIYQLLGIQKGDWNGAVPVIEKFNELKVSNKRWMDAYLFGDYKDDDMDRLLAETPKQSLVEHDVEVIEGFACWLKSDKHLDKDTHDNIVEYANNLRKASEGK